MCVQGCVCTPKEGGGATEWWWWWWWEHSLHGSLYVHVVFVSRVHSSRHTWNPPPPPPPLTPYSQDFYDAFHRPQRKPPPDVKAAMAALSQHPLQAACTIPGLLAHLRAYIQVWAPLVSTQRTHREGERAVCAHPATHAVPPSLPPFTMSHPFPPPPPTQHEPVLHRFFCCVRSSKDAAQRAVAHRSALNQVVAQFRKHLKPGTLIVVGGGYMGQRATKGCGKPPVLQMLLKELSLYFPILVVDEVSCPALLLVKPRCCPLMPDALRRSHTCSSSRQKCVRGARSEWRHRHVGASSASRATKR